MWALTVDLTSAAAGVTSRTSEAASPHVATAQVITRQKTTSATWWSAQRSRDHYTVIRWIGSPPATEITLCSATDAQRRLMLPRRRGRVGELGQQVGHPRTQLLTWHRRQIELGWDIGLRKLQKKGEGGEAKRNRWMWSKRRQRGRQKTLWWPTVRLRPWLELQLRPKQDLRLPMIRSSQHNCARSYEWTIAAL